MNEPSEISAPNELRWVHRRADRDILPLFATRGYAERHFFPHRVTLIPKCGPDAIRLARSMCGAVRTDELWIAVLNAGPEVLGDLPAALYSDEELCWHQQHFGLPGHVAFATFAVLGESLYVLNVVSDIVQRQSRSGSHRTRINKLFRGWPYLMLNALVSFAAERGLDSVRWPTTDLVIRNTDTSRGVERAMFQRTYDDAVSRFFTPVRRGDWWIVDLAENRGQYVPLPRRVESSAGERRICICHDIEAGLGHRASDPDFALSADRSWRDSVEAMSATEERQGVAATYCIVGNIFSETKDLIGTKGVAFGFHSTDHAEPRGYRLPRILNRLSAVKSLRKVSGNLRERAAGLYSGELDACRSIDYRARGYRPPQSRLPGKLTVNRFAYYNFDWLASSAGSLGQDVPTVDGPVVRIPVAFDDFALYRAKMPYAEWQEAALEAVSRAPFVCLSLHDCYGPWWLPHYAEFLDRLQQSGRMTTLDQVANEQFVNLAV